MREEKKAEKRQELVGVCLDCFVEKANVAIVLEDISDIKSMMDHLGELADKMSPTMRFLVSVCVSHEYGEKVKPSLVRLAERKGRNNRLFTIKRKSQTTL